MKRYFLYIIIFVSMTCYCNTSWSAQTEYLKSIEDEISVMTKTSDAIAFVNSRWEIYNIGPDLEHLFFFPPNKLSHIIILPDSNVKNQFVIDEICNSIPYDQFYKYVSAHKNDSGMKEYSQAKLYAEFLENKKNMEFDKLLLCSINKKLKESLRLFAMSTKIWGKWDFMANNPDYQPLLLTKNGALFIFHVKHH